MHFADPREAREFLAAHPEVRSIELFLIDANGVPRGKLLHRDELLAVYESGRPLPSTILGLTINGDDVEETGLVWDVGDADCWTFPLPGSLTLQPWRQSPTGQVQVSMHPELGLPAAAGDPRHVLQRVIHSLQAEGFHPVMAVELEFYLLDRERDSDGRPLPALQMNGQRPRATQVYGVYELEQLQPFLDDLYAACEAQACRRARRFRSTRRGRWKLPCSIASTRSRRSTKACATSAWSRAWRIAMGCRPASWPSRSPIFPAAACTCTSAWPTPLATICSPARTRPGPRCCARPSVE